MQQSFHRTSYRNGKREKSKSVSFSLSVYTIMMIIVIVIIPLSILPTPISLFTFAGCFLRLFEWWVKSEYGVKRVEEKMSVDSRVYTFSPIPFTTTIIQLSLAHTQPTANIYCYENGYELYNKPKKCVKSKERVIFLAGGSACLWR